MTTIYPYLFQTHMVMGAFALVVFWTQIFSRKGSRFHAHGGWIYVYCMAASVGAAIILAAATVIDPTWRITLDAPPANFERAYRSARAIRLWFLIGGLLAVACGIQGILALKHKRTLAGAIRAPWLVAFNCLIVLMSVAGVAYYVLNPGMYLVMALIFSPVAIWLPVWNIRYLYRKQRGRRDWLYTHLASMVISGLIGHLAVLISRGPRWFGFGWGGGLTTLLALSPLYIGIPAIVLYIRRDRKRFARQDPVELPAEPPSLADSVGGE